MPCGAPRYSTVSKYGAPTEWSIAHVRLGRHHKRLGGTDGLKRRARLIERDENAAIGGLRLLAHHQHGTNPRGQHALGNRAAECRRNPLRRAAARMRAYDQQVGTQLRCGFDDHGRRRAGPRRAH